MTNTSCSDIFGVQYCESVDKSENSGLYLAVFVALTAVVIGVALASSGSLSGLELLDVPMIY